MRWKDSNWPTKWAKKHNYLWDNNDWLQLLEDLKLSSFWPMNPDNVGKVLEEIKHYGKVNFNC